MVDGTLRLYGNPLKLVLLLAGSLAFLVGGVFMLQAPMSWANADRIIGGSLAVGFFGLGVVVFLIVLLRRLMLRQPILQVDSLGWTYCPELGFRTQRISWSEVGGVAIYRQELGTNRIFRWKVQTRMYHLVLNAKHPDMMPSSRARALTAALYPSLSRVLMIVPLNSCFVRTTPAKVARLLRNIEARFAGELRGYGIAVADEILEM